MEIGAPGEASAQEVMAYDSTAIRFRVSEAESRGAPIGGLRPLAWMTRRKEGEALPEGEQCRRHIKSLLAGRLARTAEVNLNEYVLVTLDDNNSISIIDPQIESSKTKTLGMVSLSAKGSDFVLAKDRRHVLVTLPTVGKLALADLHTRRARYVEIGGAPWDVSLSPDGGIAWVGDREGTEVTAVAVEGLQPRGRFEVGPGPHLIAFAAEGDVVWTAGTQAAGLVAIDARGFERLHEVPIDGTLVALAASAHSGQVYAALRDGTVLALEARTGRETSRLELAPGLRFFRITPDGRFGFAGSDGEERLVVVDLSINAPVHEIASGSVPEDVVFSESFAYVRHATSAERLLVDLTTLRGDPSSTPVTLGQRPPLPPGPAGPAPLEAALPEGGGLLLLNPADRTIYHFMEGMNAPMGGYRTYPWPARGLLLSDQTLYEVSEGVYGTEFEAPSAGRYTVPFLVATSPRLWGCFDLEVASRPNVEPEPEAFEMEIASLDPTHSEGARQRVRVRLVDPRSGAPVADVPDLVLLALAGPTAQSRAHAEPVGDGFYEAVLELSRSGRYLLMASSRSRAVAFGDIESVSIHFPDLTASNSHRSSFKQR